MNAYEFIGLRDAGLMIEEWRQDYKQVRPNSVLEYLNPDAFAHHRLGVLGSLPELA